MILTQTIPWADFSNKQKDKLKRRTHRQKEGMETYGVLLQKLWNARCRWGKKITLLLQRMRGKVQK